MGGSCEKVEGTESVHPRGQKRLAKTLGQGGGCAPNFGMVWVGGWVGAGVCVCVGGEVGGVWGTPWELMMRGVSQASGRGEGLGEMRWWGEGTEGVWPPRPGVKGIGKLSFPQSSQQWAAGAEAEGVSPVLHEYSNNRTK